MADPVRLIPSASRGEAQPQARGTSPALKFAVSGYIVLALFGLLALSVLAHQTAYFPFDLTLTQSVQKLASPPLDALALSVDWLGYLPEILLITAAVAIAQFVAGWRWEAVLTVISAVLAGASVDVLKLLVRRPRPEVAGIHVYKALGDFTYPSGHVCSYFMIFGLAAYFCYIWVRSAGLRAFLLTALIGLVVLVGPVRMYLGGHWPSDVLAGYLLGSLGWLLMVRLYWWGKPRFFVRRNPKP